MIYFYIGLIILLVAIQGKNGDGRSLLKAVFIIGIIFLLIWLFINSLWFLLPLILIFGIGSIIKPKKRTRNYYYRNDYGSSSKSTDENRENFYRNNSSGYTDEEILREFFRQFMGGAQGFSQNSNQRSNQSSNQRSYQNFEDFFNQNQGGKSYGNNRSRNQNPFSYMEDKSKYYAVLGVSETATKDEIKKAYLKKVKENHPDRFSGASESEKKRQEKKLQEINEAYEKVYKNFN